jgi:hypothetical protein
MVSLRRFHLFKTEFVFSILSNQFNCTHSFLSCPKYTPKDFIGIAGHVMPPELLCYWCFDLPIQSFRVVSI